MCTRNQTDEALEATMISTTRAVCSEVTPMRCAGLRQTDASVVSFFIPISCAVHEETQLHT